MKNCLIFGSGRSGTSMVGGMLHDAGYFMGEDLYPARDSNPKGFFENDFINGINERILKTYDQHKSLLHRLFVRRTDIYSPGTGQHWLCAIPANTNIDSKDSAIIEDIERACAVRTFAYKDPRFSYTLPVWERYLPDETVYLVVFREPSVAVSSIIKECADIEYLKNMQITRQDAYLSWYHNYSHVLKNYNDRKDKYFFVNYEQVLEGGIVGKLSSFLSVTIKQDFVDPSLRRSGTIEDVPGDVYRLYLRLNELAGYSG